MIEPMTHEELIARAESLPEMPDWEKDTRWGENRISMRRHFFNADPEDLLCWSTVTATMFVGENKVTRKALELLKLTDRWDIYFLLGINECDFGSPKRMKECPTTSGNLVHQAYHLSQWERITERRVEDAKKIIEFGGGYGAMCAIARRLGFKGEYVIIDLPEMSLLQEFYLSNLRMEATYISCDLSTDLRDCVPRNCDLMIAMHSLSETPVAMRNNFMDAITPRSWLMSYQAEFLTVDNKHWFNMLTERNKGYEHVFFTSDANTNINYLVSYMKGSKLNV
ncbi:MAG: hypothetical protein ACW99G_18540 [Candidatus Thorarchaeota archaeon]|jgi:hypothetical protein